MNLFYLWLTGFFVFWSLMYFGSLFLAKVTKDNHYVTIRRSDFTALFLSIFLSLMPFINLFVSGMVAFSFCAALYESEEARKHRWHPVNLIVIIANFVGFKVTDE